MRRCDRCPLWRVTKVAAKEDCLNDILSAQAIEGLMEPDDVASTYLFLASDQACNITGQALSVDRGELLT